MRASLAWFAVASALLLGAVPPAAAQQSRQVVVRQLESVPSMARGQGYSLDRGAFGTGSLVGLLPASGTVALEMELRAGTEYMIVGVCDEDCDDLDLRMNDADSETLDDDLLDDDAPILTFTPRKSGPHSLIISMASCSANSCYFGLSVNRK
jgi:hypothetical protein